MGHVIAEGLGDLPASGRICAALVETAGQRWPAAPFPAPFLRSPTSPARNRPNRSASASPVTRRAFRNPAASRHMTRPPAPAPRPPRAFSLSTLVQGPAGRRRTASAARASAQIALGHRRDPAQFPGSRTGTFAARFVAAPDQAEDWRRHIVARLGRLPASRRPADRVPAGMQHSLHRRHFPGPAAAPRRAASPFPGPQASRPATWLRAWVSRVEVPQRVIGVHLRYPSRIAAAVTRQKPRPQDQDPQQDPPRPGG